MYSILISILISFFTVLIVTPKLIKFLTAAGVVGLDLHKKNKPKLPSSGGICVAIGLIAGIFTYITIQTFVYGNKIEALNLFAVISSILIVSWIGLFDDINIRSKIMKTKEGMDIRVGLPQSKWILTLPAAIPLIVIASGDTTMSIPFFGNINFGLIYPFVLVPLGVVGASNVVNLLGGFNGIEAGMGCVYMLSLGLYALLQNNPAGVIFLSSFGALLAFLSYNKYPAKILPGDSLTYLLGSTVAAGVIVGNMEKAGVIVLTPFIIEFFLKARSKFKASCLGKLRKDGRLNPPYGKKIYSITHILLQFHPTEKQVTITMILIAGIFALIPFLGIV
ncbi:MAG: hypothetical protein QXU74_01230 [Candidatus Aenigmatarchaeota archaeon]